MDHGVYGRGRWNITYSHMQRRIWQMSCNTISTQQDAKVVISININETWKD